MDGVEELKYLIRSEDTSNYICSLCDNNNIFKYKSKALRHLKQLHFGHTVTFEGNIMVLCKKRCHQYSHYHCFCCENIYPKKQDLIYHLDNTQVKTTAKRIKIDSACKEEEKKKNTPVKVSCDECNEKMLRKNLRTHILQKHSKFKGTSINSQRYHEGVCIDEATGLYMLAETLNGIHYPVHVQKSLLGKQTQILVCDSKSCEYMNTVASISDKVSYECPHLLSIQYITNYARIINLEVSVLDKMVLEKIIKPESKDACKDVYAMAKSLGKILAATWEPLEYQSVSKYVYFCVGW